MSLGLLGFLSRRVKSTPAPLHLCPIHKQRSPTVFFACLLSNALTHAHIQDADGDGDKDILFYSQLGGYLAYLENPLNECNNGNGADVTSPIIQLLGPVSAFDNLVPQCSVYVEPGFSVTDGDDGQLLKGLVTMSGDYPIKTSVPGVYSVVYDVEDLSGNEVCPRGEDWPMRASERLSSFIYIYIYICITLNTHLHQSRQRRPDSELDTVAVLLTPQAQTQTRYLTVIEGNNQCVNDKTKPAIKLMGGKKFGKNKINQCESYEEEGFTVKDSGPDDLDNLADAVIKSGYVDSSVPGKYTIFYDVTDSNGNSGQAQRKVRVLADDNAQC